MATLNHSMADLGPGVGASGADRLLRIGRVVALIGVFMPLFWIGIKKFTQVEVDAVKPLVHATPWIAWLPKLLGDNGTSYFLGAVEVPTSLLFLASPWSRWAGIIAGAVGTLTFAITSSIMLAYPIWEPRSGGFPFMTTMGAFLSKDVALLGISLVVLAESLRRPA